MNKVLLSTVYSTVLSLLPTLARAAGPLGENGTTLETSQYSIDLFLGSVVAGNRVTGMGGAYVAIAEDVDGNLLNPAAPAMRPFHSIDRFDFWPGLGLTVPAAGQNGDFFNSGGETDLSRANTSLFITPALNLQWGSLGFGFASEIQSYKFPSASTEDGTPAAFEVDATTSHLQVADSYFGGQLVVGVGVRLLTFSVARQVERQAVPVDLFKSSGNGLEVGAVWRPRDKRYRLGFSLREAVETEAEFSRNLLPRDNGDIVLEAEDGAFYLPERVSLPWDLNVGIAAQWGARPFNPEWKSPRQLAERQFLEQRLRVLNAEPRKRRLLNAADTDEERAWLQAEFEKQEELEQQVLTASAKRAKQQLLNSFGSIDRFFLLVSASLRIAGAVDNAVGVESFFAQTVNRSGRRVVLSPHLGMEAEAWPDILKLRAGTYLQPTRFATASQRLHGTLGGDLRLFSWSAFGLWPDDFTWALGANLDLASDYVTWGLTLTGWYPRPSSG